MKPSVISRREFIENSVRGVAALGAGASLSAVVAQEPGARPDRAGEVQVVNPRARVPVGLIIDDSTCLS